MTLPGVAELRAQIVSGARTAEEVIGASLSRAASVGTELHAFIVVDHEGALQEARALDARKARGDAPGPLHGIPVAIKDLVRTRGLPTTGGSRALGEEDMRGPEALLVRRLRRAGAVVVGKTNLNEFAYGVTGANAHYGDSLNPWDPQRMSGGSSGGSAVAVMAGIVPLSVGTDTRGSIRIPSACCGGTGFKPTRGRIPLHGVFPLSRTLDHAGPMARTVEDAFEFFLAMLSPRSAADLRERVQRTPVSGLRLGIPASVRKRVHPEVRQAFEASIESLSALGLRPVEFDLPELDESLDASAVIVAAESLELHEGRMEASPERFDPVVLDRLERGRPFTAVDLSRALSMRDRLMDAVRRAARTVDLMVGPTLPGLPPQVGAPTVNVGGGEEEIVVRAFCRFMAPQNMIGAPALSIPCGFSSTGLPMGLHLWAPPGQDARVLAAGLAFQAGTDFHRRVPPIATEGF
jgi:aspartyl-tRNA(Asn)/glutamyl-tRNA(Gln) amidotransferase subunit A